MTEEYDQDTRPVLWRQLPLPDRQKTTPNGLFASDPSETNTRAFGIGRYWPEAANLLMRSLTAKADEAKIYQVERKPFVRAR